MTTRAPFSVSDVALWGPNLVGASAGTGKTYAIASLFVRLLLEANLPAHKILVVTFTEAATAELRDRVRAAVRECLALATGEGRATPDPTLQAIVARAGGSAAPKLTQALYDFDRSAISTIHGFCQRTLLERAFQSDVTINSELFGDARPLIDDLVLDYWARELCLASPELVAFLRATAFTPRTARSLAYTALRQPDCLVLPAARAGSDAGVDSGRLWQIFEHVRDIWCHPEAQVAHTIRASNINKRSYSPRHVTRWLEQVNEFFTYPSRPLFKLPLGFERFCSHALAAAGAADIAGRPVFAACEALWQEHARIWQELERQALAFKLRLVEFLRREVPERTRAQNRLSFDDLLHRLRGALAPPRGGALAQSLRERYPAALIDEFQDTDPVQYAIFDAIYRGSDNALFLIGDPKQAIYSFRGADIVTYLGAARATPEGRRHTMVVNYRSDPSLLAALNAFFGRVPNPFFDAEIEYQPVQPRPGREDALLAPDGTSKAGLEILFVDDELPEAGKLERAWTELELPKLVAKEIADLLTSGALIAGKPIQAGDVAVLTRTNDQAFQIQNALREVGVAAVVLGDKTVYRSTEAQELMRLLSAIVEPSNPSLVKAALATELLGVTAPEICALDQDDRAWEGWLEDFRAWNLTWSQVGFVQMFRALMTRRYIQERLLKLSDGERRMTNLLHLAELLHSAAVRSHLGPSGLLAFLNQQIRRETFGVEAEAEQIRLESDARAVKITTMHKSKGLEYPVVYCPHLWSGLLKHPNDIAPRFHTQRGELALDLGSPEQEHNENLAAREVFAENLRLAYVALTRARHRTTLVWGRIGRFFATSPLAHLLHPRDPGPLGSSDAPALDVIEAHVRSLSTAAMWQDLGRLAAGPNINLRRVSWQVPARARLDRGARSPALTHRQPSARIDNAWRTSSFSALTSAATSHEAVALEQGPHDHDHAIAQPSDLALTIAETPFAVADFPRGAKAGSFFHELFEHYDFVSARPGPLRALVRNKLVAYNFPVEPWTEPVCRALWTALDTPLSAHAGDPLTLGGIGQKDRLNELEFCLPVLASKSQGAVRTAGGELALDAARLSRVFREQPSPALPAAYADSITRLDFLPLRGFLRGFIDLVFVHRGRYFVVDYKTNHLGRTPGDYGADALGEAMRQGHYYLQYHLYTLAVHRYLTRRLKGYDYETHFGGAYYLFIKGMHPELGQSGVFFEKPPWARLQALSDLLELQQP
jgi:exodeoxyribonuclease V beta subunit